MTFFNLLFLKRFFAAIIFVTVLSSVFISCDKNTRELTPEEKFTVDTLFNNQINHYRKELDSICVTEKDTLFARTVDSLKKEGMKEIEMLIMKNHLTE